MGYHSPYGGHITQKGNHTGYHSPYGGHTTHLTRQATHFTASREPYTYSQPWPTSPARWATARGDKSHIAHTTSNRWTAVPIEHSHTTTSRTSPAQTLLTRDGAVAGLLSPVTCNLSQLPDWGGCRVYTMKYFILVTADHVGQKEDCCCCYIASIAD